MTLTAPSTIRMRRISVPSGKGVRNACALLGLGVLSALALPPVHAMPGLFFTLPALLTAIDRAPSWQKAAWAGGLFGFGLYAASLYWLVNAVMVRAEEFWWFLPFPSLGCALILAPMTAAPAALCRLAPAGPRRMALFAALWTLFDMGRVFLFSGFPWNPLGSSFALPGRVGDVLIQPAAWIGVDGMTLLLVLTALFCGTAIREGIQAARGNSTQRPQLSGTMRRITLGLTSGLVVLWVGAGLVRLHSTVPTGPLGPLAVIVQGNVPEVEKVGHQNPRTVFERYLTLTAQGVERAKTLRTADPTTPERPIVFLWPETSFPGYTLLQDSPRARQLIMAWAAGADAGFIGALRLDDEGRYRNALLALAPDGGIEAIYDKARLVPFGEYQPPHIPLQIVPQGGLAAGPGPQTWHLPAIPPVGPLICYEVIFSGAVVEKTDRPRWFANVTNDGWFGDSAGPRQHLSSVRLRAVEEGLPVARAANTGISIAYDGFGHELARLGWNKANSLVLPLPAALPAPLFAQYGKAIPLLLCLLAGISACLPIARRKQVQ